MTNPNAPSVETQLYGPVAVIQFASPQGTIDIAGAIQLTDAITNALNDNAVQVLVLTGEGHIFIRHADVHQIRRAGAALASGKIAPESFIGAPFHQLGELVERAPKPVIAAINGTCMGGGFELALACHLRIAQYDVRHIGLPEIRLDIIPGSGGMERLAQLLGPHKARRIVLDGHTYDAETALSEGLVDAVEINALDAAVQRGQMWSRRSPQAVRAILDLYRQPATNTDASVKAFAELLDGAQPTLDAFCEGDSLLEDLA